jgi:hypothetical protein
VVFGGSCCFSGQQVSLWNTGSSRLQPNCAGDGRPNAIRRSRWYQPSERLLVYYCRQGEFKVPCNLRRCRNVNQGSRVEDGEEYFEDYYQMSTLTVQSTHVTDTVYCYRWESPPAFMKDDGAQSSFHDGLPKSVPPPESPLTLFKIT